MFEGRQNPVGKVQKDEVLLNNFCSSLVET